MCHGGLPPDICNFSCLSLPFSVSLSAVLMSAEPCSCHKASYYTNSDSRLWICKTKFPFAPMVLFSGFYSQVFYAVCSVLTYRAGHNTTCLISCWDKKQSSEDIHDEICINSGYQDFTLTCSSSLATTTKMWTVTDEKRKKTLLITCN